MRALAALILEAKIKFYQWARHEMSPLHPDLPHVVRRLHELEAQRPRVEHRPRSRCADMPGMCARDPNCEDRHCPGLYTSNGGMEVYGSISFPIEHEDPAPPAPSRASLLLPDLFGACCALAVVACTPLLPF